MIPAVHAPRAPTLVEYSGSEQPRPAHDVVLAACDMDVKIEAGLATIETRERFANHGNVATAAAYEFDLPVSAKIVGVSARVNGSSEVGVAVPTGYNTDAVADAEVLGADPVVVQLDSAGDARTTAPTLQPIGTNDELLVTTTWIVPATVRNGALRVGDARPRLRRPRCHVPRHRQACDRRPGGATVARIVRSPARRSAAAAPRPARWATSRRRDRRRARVRAPRAASIVDPAPRRCSATAGPASWSPSSRRPLKVDHGMLRAPRDAACTLIDEKCSRSMDMIGAAAIGKVVDAVAAALPTGTELDAIVYDRTATRVQHRRVWATCG